MISGRQIREARGLLQWSLTKLAYLTKLQVSTLMRAEATDAEPAITVAQAMRIKSIMEAAGVEFDQGQSAVKLQDMSH